MRIGRLGTQQVVTDHVRLYRSAIQSGWRSEPRIIGRDCQLCDRLIWGDGYVRPADEWSPTIYRHVGCHEAL